MAKGNQYTMGAFLACVYSYGQEHSPNSQPKETEGVR